MLVSVPPAFPSKLPKVVEITFQVVTLACPGNIVTRLTDPNVYNCSTTPLIKPHLVPLQLAQNPLIMPIHQAMPLSLALVFRCGVLRGMERIQFVPLVFVDVRGF